MIILIMDTQNGTPNFGKLPYIPPAPIWRKPDNTQVDLEGACEASLACSTCHVILNQDRSDSGFPKNCRVAPLGPLEMFGNCEGITRVPMKDSAEGVLRVSHLLKVLFNSVLPNLCC